MQVESLSVLCFDYHLFLTLRLLKCDAIIPGNSLVCSVWHYPVASVLNDLPVCIEVSGSILVGFHGWRIRASVKKQI